MRIVVCVDAALDAGMPIRPTEDGRALIQGLSGGPDGFRIGASARSALEMALALSPTEVIAVSVGGEEANRVLAWCKARGAADARHVDARQALWSAANVAGNLVPVIAALAPTLVLCGSKGDRSGSGAVPRMIADMLGWPCLDRVMAADIAGNMARVVRRLPKGWREDAEVALPAVLGCSLATAAPRYVSRRAQRKAMADGVNRTPAAAHGPEPQILGFATARAQPPKPPRPAAPAKAQERIRAMLGGARKTPGRDTGDGPDTQVANLIDFLAEHSILD